jgi:hypothetical protein
LLLLDNNQALLEFISKHPLSISTIFQQNKENYKHTQRHDDTNIIKNEPPYLVEIVCTGKQISIGRYIVFVFVDALEND